MSSFRDKHSICTRRAPLRKCARPLVHRVWVPRPRAGWLGGTRNLVCKLLSILWRTHAHDAPKSTATNAVGNIRRFGDRSTGRRHGKILKLKCFQRAKLRSCDLFAINLLFGQLKREGANLFMRRNFLSAHKKRGSPSLKLTKRILGASILNLPSLCNSSPSPRTPTSKNLG